MCLERTPIDRRVGPFFGTTGRPGGVRVVGGCDGNTPASDLHSGEQSRRVIAAIG